MEGSAFGLSHIRRETRTSSFAYVKGEETREPCEIPQVLVRKSENCLEH